MTLWQSLLVFACACFLAAGASVLRARRLPTSSFAGRSRFSIIFTLLMGTFFLAEAIWIGWPDYPSAQRIPTIYLLSLLQVGVTLLLLAISLFYFLAQAALFARHVRRRAHPEVPDGR